MSNLRATRIETLEPVYIGFGPYASQIYLTQTPNLPGTTPVAESYSSNAQGWWIVMPSGVTILIPHGNVRFVCFETLAEKASRETVATQSGATDGHADESPQSVSFNGQAENAAEEPIADQSVDEGEKVDTSVVHATEDSPKKRGRPPKNPWSV